jgi:nicotinate-nucleotide pyrophosphorylase (carboxylating)
MGKGTSFRLLNTRKTLPDLCVCQKYAVSIVASVAIALKDGVEIIILNNFNSTLMVEAVELNNMFNNAQDTYSIGAGSKLEASGGITMKTLRSYAETGVDCISIGALTKDCNTVDLSVRLF